MKNYTIEVIKTSKHGRYKANHRILTVLTVEANNKKEASEIALQSLIGKRAGDFGEYGFPISLEHAPEAIRKGEHSWEMPYMASKEHLINEFDIRMNDVITKVTINK